MPGRRSLSLGVLGIALLLMAAPLRCGGRNCPYATSSKTEACQE